MILIVAHHDVVATHPKVAGDCERVLGIDFYFHSFNDFATRFLLIDIRWRVGDERSALCHAVADCVREIDATQECFDVGIQGCSTDNDFVDIAAKRLVKTIFDFGEQLFVEEWHFEHHFHQRLFEHWENFVFDDFLKDERHSDDEFRFHFGKCAKNNFWRRHASEEVKVATLCESVEHIDYHAVEVGKWQHIHDSVARLEEREVVVAIFHIAPDVFIG